MKFCNKYEEIMQGLGKKKLPGIGCRKLKNILKDCKEHHSVIDQDNGDGISTDDPRPCSVCEETFFPLVLKEMSRVVRFFDKRAQRLLAHHLASGCCKCFIWMGDRLIGNDIDLIQECDNLITYASINAIAMRRILKKYDKIHYSKQGQAFKSRAASMQIDILQSPWLYELMAFHINLKVCNANMGTAPVLLEGLSPSFDSKKPSLSFELFDSVKLNIELTCSICLETLFDPISLRCGHLFCYTCACKAGSVSFVDGLTTVSSHKKCPICREVGVFESAVNLEELHILLKRSCPEYWEDRRRTEKAERVQQAKQHWQSQAARFMGI